MTEPVDTSIVVCTCSRVHLLRRSLDSLLAQTWALSHVVELVVVDDGSTDDTPEYLHSLEGRGTLPIRCIPGPCQGIAAARNAGFTAARGRWLASFDDDQIAGVEWLQALRERADKASADVLGGALTLLLPPEASRIALGPRVRAVLGEHKPFSTAQPYTGACHPATNNALFRRNLFFENGGFDTRFTEGGEDKEFFNRLKAAGASVWFEPAAMAGHITPEHRLETSNLRWTSLRLGAADARLHRLKGRGHAFRLTCLRALITTLRDLPQLLLPASSRGMDTLCSLWYTEGLVRAFVSLCFSPQNNSRFLRSMNFRGRNGEREQL